MGAEHKLVVLIGNKNSFNSSILEIISSDPHYRAKDFEDYEELSETGQVPDIVIINLINYAKEAILSLKELSDKLSCPVIAIHHYTESGIIRKLNEAGAQIYLKSSLTDEDLFGALRKALKGHTRSEEQVL